MRILVEISSNHFNLLFSALFYWIFLSSVNRCGCSRSILKNPDCETKKTKCDKMLFLMKTNKNGSILPHLFRGLYMDYIYFIYYMLLFLFIYLYIYTHSCKHVPTEGIYLI